MGYTKNGSITNFWPDDTDDMLYIQDSYGISLIEIISKATEKWPGVRLDDLEISAEYIHTHCIYYDLHDSGDYTNFIVIKKI
jgi:hypothetical protein